MQNHDAKGLSLPHAFPLHRLALPLFLSRVFINFSRNRFLFVLLFAWLEAGVSQADTIQRRVAAGLNHSLTLKEDGTLWSWGYNSYGQLGIGSTVDQWFPVQVSSLSNVVAAAGGSYHSVAVKSDGTVWAWGYNISGQLGDGTTTNRSVAVAVSGLTGAVAVAAGGYHTLALKSDGTVWAWGNNGNGQLGDGTTTQRNTPVQVSGLSGVIAVAAGQYFSLALKSDGTVWGWGYNGYGQLGDGTSTNRSLPVRSGTIYNVVAIAAGLQHGVALKADGTVWDWGSNPYGQLGDSTTSNRLLAVQASGVLNVVAVAAGQNHTVAVKSDGTVMAWGWNTYGQLGDGTTTQRNTAVSLSGVSGAAAIVAGTHSLILKGDGNILGTGLNTNGQLGIGTNASRSTPASVVSFTYAGQVATPSFSPEGGTYLQPQSVTVSCATLGATIRYTTNGADPSASDAVVASGSAVSIGNTALFRAKAFLSGYSPSNTKSGLYQIGGYVVSGLYHSLAIKPDGTLWSWGYNNYGQLGNGGTGQQWSPGQVVGLNNVVAAAGGANHSVAAKADGTVWAWGYNAYGELGDGTTTNRSTPVRVSGLTGVTAVAAGDYHSVALKSDGTVWAWGNNSNGRLGDGTATQRNTPVQVSGLSGVIAITAGSSFTLALKSDGTVWGWGYNYYGSLGNGNSVDSYVPIRSGTIYDVVAIGAGYLHAVALKTDGTVWDWGYNPYGQLGNGTTNNSFVAVQAVGVTNAIGVAAGQYHTLAVKSDGTVMAWGYNAQGQLGDGTNTNRSTPVAVVNLTGVISVSAGTHSVVTARYSGVNLIWAWGSNNSGQLGDETTVNKNVPVLTHTSFDFDQDGLPDWKEITLGSDPHSPDTDADGMPDGWEVNYGLNPLLNDASADPDGDGFTNLQEYQNRTDPLDYYNGATFNLNISSGDGQASPPSSWLPQPLVVQVTNGSAAPLVNAPVTFSLGQSSGGLSQTNGGSTVSSLVLRTDSAGNARAYFQQPQTTHTVSAITAQSGTNTVKSITFFASTATIPVSGLKLWLRADSGVSKDANNFVTRWADQSGNNNDGIQNTTSYQPRWVDATLNGKPIVRFDGINDQLVAASSAGSNDFTIFAVAKTANTHEIDVESALGTSGTSGQRYLFGAFNPGGAGVSMGTNGISVYEHAPYYMPAVAVFQGQVGSDSNIVTVKYTARQPQIFLNGYLARTGLTSTLATVSAPTQIGSGAYGAFGGAVAEILIYNSALTDSDRLVVERYLNNKYNVIPSLPEAPINLAARAISSSQIDLVWTSASTNAINFTIERKLGVSGTFSDVATVNSKLTTYVDKDLAPDIQYFYRVRVTTLAGDSDPSNLADATTLNDAPPVTFDGLTVWLRSDAGVLKDGSNRVTSWTDQSNSGRNGNDARQATIDNQPVWVDNAIYNKPAIQFDGINDQLVTTNAPSTNNFTIFVVAQTSQPHEIDVESTSSTAGTSGQHYLFGAFWRGSDTGAGVSMGTNGISVYEHGANVMAPLAVDNESVNGYSVVTVRYASKQPQIYLNGVLGRVRLTSPRTNVYAPIEIGSGAYGAFNGTVAEVLIYNAALSESDRRGVENYLGRKYGLIDSDHDDLTDQEELQYGTDPYNPDTNGDGILDGTAIQLGISATSMDTDGDGLTNAQERVLGTDPLVADTDRDGVPDEQDAYPLDPTRSQVPAPDPNDHTPPVITLIEPADAVLLP